MTSTKLTLKQELLAWVVNNELDKYGENRNELMTIFDKDGFEKFYAHVLDFDSWGSMSEDEADYAYPLKKLNKILQRHNIDILFLDYMHYVKRSDIKCADDWITPVKMPELNKPL